MNQKSHETRHGTALEAGSVTASPRGKSQQIEICHDYEHQRIWLEPECPEIDKLLELRTIQVTDEERHGYRVTRHNEPLLGHGVRVANGGLALVVQYFLEVKGHKTWRMPLFAKPIPEAIAAPMAVGPANPHVCDFIRGNTHGVIEHGLGFNGLAALCIELALAYPTVKFAFIARQEEEGEAFAKKIGKVLGPVTLAFANRRENLGARIAVCTSYGLGDVELFAVKFNALMFLDAAAAVGLNSQDAIIAYGQSRLFAFQKQDQQVAPRTSDLIMAAFGPRLVTVPQLGFRNRHVEIADLRITGAQLSNRLTGFALYRAGIIGHRVRNRRIASLATALVANDTAKVQRLCPDASGFANGRPCATLVLVANIEHGLALKRLLPGWPLVIGNDANVDGLSQAQIKMLDERPIVFDRAIATVAGMSTIRSSGFKAMIWAAGGMGLEVPQLITGADDERIMLWIDVDDRHHPQLRRASRLRRRDYIATDWFPVGIPTFAGRIAKFIAERSEDYR